MCIIIDPPLFLPLFKSTHPSHAEYQPIKQWIDNGPGKFVLGGTQYTNELNGVCSVLPLLAEYERGGKVVRNSNATIDTDVIAVKAIEPKADFDDPHLVSLVRVCGCKLICINDPRAHRFLRAAKFYQSLKHRPKLYTRAKNATLLCPTNIAPCCKKK